MQRIRRDRKGVSNIIVIALSFVVLTIIVSQVILWSYQMNQHDWERMHEDVKITDVTRVNSSSWFTAQNEYEISFGSKISGAYTDTQAADNQYESFREGLDWWNANYTYRRQVTIMNNMLSSVDIGYSIYLTLDTASLFSAGKMLESGNDLRVSYQSGNGWIELDREIIDMDNANTQVWFKNQAKIGANSSDSNYYVYYGNPSARSPPSNKSNVYLWFDDFNRADNPDITTETSYKVKTGGGVWSIESNTLKNVGAAGDPNKLIINALGNVNASVDMLVKINVAAFSGGDRSRMGLSCCMDTNSARGSGYCGLLHQNRNSLDLLNDLRSWGTRGTYSWSLNTWYYMRFRVMDPDYRLGKVKVWQVGAVEPNAWTVDSNFGGGTARGYGELGFAGSRTADTTYFDDVVIRYIIDSEPSSHLGTEESQVSNRLDVNCAFVIDTSTYILTYIKSVEIQMLYKSSDSNEKWYLKAYNWTASTFSDNGFNSTTGNNPTAEWRYYTVNLTDQWSSYLKADGNVYVKFVDEIADNNQTTIDINFFAIRVVINGTKFTFENKMSSTCHLVSLWVNNSTHHQRYNIDAFINSGDVTSCFRSDISLPKRHYVIKIVTERGNIAIYSKN